jgi:hypothetical protein
MILFNKGKMSYIKLIVGEFPFVCPCLRPEPHQFGAKMTPSRGKRKEIPLETPPTDENSP